MTALCLCLVAAGCKSPFDRTRDASGGGGTGTLSGSSNFVIFSDELKTGGGAFEYPGGENQSLSFADTSNPISRRSIRYSWNGQPTVAGSADATFAGFDLMHVVDNTPTLTIYAATPGRDLRQTGYTKATFYARGTLASNTVLKIEVSDDGNTSTSDPCLVLSAAGTDNSACDANGLDLLKMPAQVLTSSWRQYTITIPTASLGNVKDLFKATFVFAPSYGAIPQGGVIYVDQIQYEH